MKTLGLFVVLAIATIPGIAMAHESSNGPRELSSFEVFGPTSHHLFSLENADQPAIVEFTAASNVTHK